MASTQCKAQTEGPTEALIEEQAVDVESKRTAISDAINKVMKLHDIPAVSCCIVVGDDTFFINNGTLSRRSKEEVDERSIYQIASLSKTFVGIVTHELVRNETIKTSDSIATYLPNTIDEATKQKVQPVSILDLAQHRSGLPRDTLNPKMRQKKTYVNGDYNETDLLKDLTNMQLDFVPGKQFMYSNYGYSLLAYLLERASGKEYSQLVQDIVTKPMKMSDTGFEVDLVQKQRLATPYDHNAPSVAREPARIGKLGPPTSLYSTTADLAELMKKQMADYRKYHETKEVTNLILTPLAKDAWAGSGIKYGFGFMDWGDGGFGHGGGMDGYGSEFTFDPKKNLGFILLTSSCSPWTQRLTAAVNRTITDGKTQSLDEFVAVESIVAQFEKGGAEAALRTYQKLRSQSPSPLGEEARITLVNLANQKGLPDAVKLFASDALNDFPKSKRMKKLAKAAGNL